MTIQIYALDIVNFHDPDLKLKNLIPFLFLGRREDSDDKGSLPERTTVTSILRFKPSAGDNSQNIACEAQHPALTTEPLRASIKMFVQCKYCIQIRPACSS